MTTLTVATHHSGSYVVVFKNREHYIDVRRDVRHPTNSFIEVVRCGQVIHRSVTFNDFAPKRIIELIKEYLL